jgi:L-cysteine S-thiosulfotransferase
MSRLKVVFMVFMAFEALQSYAALAQEKRTSGSVYLSKQMQELQADVMRNPITLWLERGQSLWQAQCKSCHGEIAALKRSSATFPRLSADGKSLINLEDQILQCQTKSSKQTQVTNAAATTTSLPITIESDDVLSLSAALHAAAKNEPIAVVAPSSTPFASIQWQTRLKSGETLYQTRMGRMNLACMHCHDQKVGAQMRADTISQGHPTGFPIYRMSWQSMGSVDRRLRACYSGVQAVIPPPGSADLRDLELYMKVRANGMPLDGPSIRR